MSKNKKCAKIFMVILMNNPFKYSNTNKRYYTYDYYLKNKYNCKVAKIGLDAGFTCPNRDGTISFGGCIFCSDGARSNEIKNINDLEEQYQILKKVMINKWKELKFIAYFQAFTNTYAPVDKLKEIYEPFINKEEVVGISIATRPDTLNLDVLDYLENIASRIPLTIELGLQTANDITAKLINRGYDFNLFVEKVKELRKRNIDVVVHLINGLPNETKQDNLETIKKIRNLDIQGIKFHSLFVEKNTLLEQLFISENYHILTIDEYIDIVISQLELLPEDIVIQRLTGDPIPSKLAFPLWAIKKINVLNGIDKEMVKRSTFQGRLYE